MAKAPPFPPKGGKKKPAAGGGDPMMFGAAAKTPSGAKGAKVAAFSKGGKVKKAC